MVKPKEIASTVRAKVPPLDHLIRAYGRFTADAGNVQAASITYFSFLSLFPLLALTAAVLGLVLGADAVDRIIEQVNNYAPGLAEQLKLRDVLSRQAAGAVGIVGLAGLLYSGLGWIDALRKGVRTIWHHNVEAGNIVVKKLKDIVALVGLGLTLLVSIAVSTVAGSFSAFFLGLVGLDGSPLASILTRVIGIALGVLTSFLLFAYLFWRLPRVVTPFKKVAGGALLMAVLFEILKQFGGVYIERTTSNPVYGFAAVAVGLLVWINIVARLLMICAAWTVTAPNDSDVPPSGTADPDMAREAGIPVEFADNDPDDPPTTQEDGAPSPLAQVLQGKTPSQDVPDDGDRRGAGGVPPGQDDEQSTRAASGAQAGRSHRDDGGSAQRGPGGRFRQLAGGGSGSSTGADRNDAGSATPVAVLDGPSKRQQHRVQQAGQFTAGAVGMLSMGVVLYVGRTLRELVRR